MPRPTLPPTPGSSTDLKGRDDPPVGFLHIPFELPPPAIANSEIRPSSIDTQSSASSSGSSYHPTSHKTAPASTARRKLAMAAVSSASKDSASFNLPPPPTRSRKIIQMKPRCQQESTSKTDTEAVGRNRAPPTASKKKQPSATSAAGRKRARKTAHSLIERRRRSKMNEEFGVLKDMIPACTGDMHKLAILQASIDYLRYLEDCVAKLKAQNNRETPTPDCLAAPPVARELESFGFENDENEGEDIEMVGSETTSPVLTGTVASMANQRRLSISPISTIQDSGYHHIAESSMSNSDKRHYSFSASATKSPAFEPHEYGYAGSNASLSSAQTSPALRSQMTSDRDIDHEATTALLMLNTDRRGIVGSASGRGMSVKDLLSA